MTGLAHTSNEIESLYSEALKQYLAGGGERSLRGGYEVGRLALANEIGLLDLAAFHHSALNRILAPADKQGEIRAHFSAAEQFFTESLSAYEMANRGYRDAVAALRRVNETLEEEVKRIAHTVHDEAGQLLAVVYLTLADITKELPADLHARMNEVNGLLHQVEDQLRELSHELRPPILDDLGLIPAIHFLADRVSRRVGLAIHVKSELHERLLPNVETALYRIVQEALNNVVRHAQAKTVWIQLQEDRRKTLCSIRDNGVGFHAQSRLSERGKKGLGLIGIQERLSAIGGTLQITSEPGRGTLLRVTVSKGSKENSDANSSGARR
jgi:signal transduction histidine kinase